MKAVAKFFAGAVLAGAAIASASAASAIPVVLGLGWLSDTVESAGTPSDSSPLTFTAVSGAYQFSLTDAFIPGDTYTIVLNGVETFTTTLGTTFTPFDNSVGPDAALYSGPWLDPTYSKIALDFGPGSYSFVVTGDCGGGCPASFGYRIDAIPTVPEPATWALMLVGLGGMGAAVRTSRRKALPAVSGI